MVTLALGKSRNRREIDLGCRRAEWTGWWNVLQKSLHHTWRMGRCTMKDPVSTNPQLRPFYSHCIPQTAKNFDVILLRYCLALRSELVVDTTMILKKHCQHDLDFALTLSCLLRTWRRRWLPLARLGFCFWVIAVDPRLISGYYFFRKSESFVAAWSMSCEVLARNSFCSKVRRRETNFAATRFMPRSFVKISETPVSRIPRSSSNYRTVNRRFSLIAVFTRSTFSGVLLV